MKKFKDILSEVAQPKAGDEKRFKAKHKIEVWEHPAAFDHQFTGEIPQADPRLADYVDEEDAMVYEHLKKGLKHGVDKVPEELIHDLGTLGDNVLGFEQPSRGIRLSFDKAISTKELAKKLKTVPKSVKFDGLVMDGTRAKEYVYTILAESVSGYDDPVIKIKGKKVTVTYETSNYIEIEYSNGKTDTLLKGTNEFAIAKKQLNDMFGEGKEYAKKTDKDDDGDGMDPVGHGDADIDNDGDSDESDEYLRNRRKAIGKAMKKESKARGHTVRKILNSLKEAKMEDSEVLAAAKKLAANGKDEKAKAFGKGLVDFYAKNKSFTPDQVAGLQNIMKNASFQLAKESAFMGKAAAAKKDNKKKFKLGDDDYPVTMKKDTADKIMGESEWSVQIGKKTYTVNAKSSSHADKKATELAKKDGNHAVPGKIQKLEETQLEENFKAGSMKLDDGSSVTVSKKDAELLNVMFKDLNAKNKKEMQKVVMTDKAGFEEILGFAREAL